MADAEDGYKKRKDNFPEGASIEVSTTYIATMRESEMDEADIPTSPSIDVRPFLKPQAETAITVQIPAKVIEMQQELNNLKSEHLPRKGACTYLLLDLASIKEKFSDKETLSSILAEAKLILNAKGYHVKSMPKIGVLRILSTAERSENSLLATAQSLSKIIPEAKIFMGSGSIDYQEEGMSGKRTMQLYEGPSDRTMAEWRTLDAGVYLTSSLSDDIKDPSSRKGSGCRIKTARTTDTRLEGLTGYEAKASLRIGGPDKLIRYEDELWSLSNLMRDDETKLIMVEGEAGIGKSRLMDTALKTLPSAVVCSLDAADKNLAGSGLVTLADQLAQIITNDPLWEMDEELEIQNFSKKTRAEKIEYAQKNPQKLAEICSDILKLLNFDKGQKTLFVLEDIHFADRFSERHLIDITNKYLTETEGKATFTMRPEEMYRSDAQKNIQRIVQGYFGENSAQTVNLTGLDFSDPAIAREFAFHSLPPQIREGKTLGTWYERLGQKAGRSPFRMKTFMDTVMERGNLIIKEDIIEVKPEVIERIESIETDGDLATHYHERIEKLPKATSTALQCIALAGGKLTSGQLTKIIMKTTGSTGDRFIQITSDLELGGYIVPQSEGSDIWQLQHDSMREIIVDSIKTVDDRKSLALYIYKILREDKTTHHDTQFELIHHIAAHPDTPMTEMATWESLNRITTALFEDAKARNATSKAYAVAEAILDDSRGIPIVRKAIEMMEQGKKLHKRVRSIVLQTLHARAESAIYLSRHEEAAQAIDNLRKIHVRFPNIIDINRVNLLEFELMYIVELKSREDAERIQTFHDQNIAAEEIAGITPAEKVIAAIKLTNKLIRFDDAIKLFKENKILLEALNDQHKKTHNGMPHPHYMEAKRLAEVRCPYENIREKIKATGIDEDIILQSGIPSKTQIKALEEIMKNLDELLALKEEYPMIFNPYAEISLFDVYGQIKALLGDPTEAKTCFSKAWRQADQAQVPAHAARAAKMKSDVTVVEALALNDPKKRKLKIKEAIKTLNEEGMIALASVGEKDFYQAAIRIQRIRATGILLIMEKLKTIDKPIPMKTQQELKPLIEKTLKDFEHVNRMYGAHAQKFVDDSTDKIAKSIKEIGYYMMSYMGHILQAGRDLEMDIDNRIYSNKENPFMHRAVICAGLEVSGRKNDKKFGNEVIRKIEGLTYLLIHLTQIQSENETPR